jgi:hypothetical protein
MNFNSSKKQLGWRKPDADNTIYLDLFRLGNHEKMHLIKHGKVTEEQGATEYFLENYFFNMMYQYF